MKIAKEFRWEMGHRLPFHEDKCKNIHQANATAQSIWNIAQSLIKQKQTENNASYQVQTQTIVDPATDDKLDLIVKQQKLIMDRLGIQTDNSHNNNTDSETLVLENNALNNKLFSKRNYIW